MRHDFVKYLLLLAAALSTVHAQGTWTRKADFPGAARKVADGASVGERAYFGLGMLASGQYARDWWEYDPSTDSWSEKASFPGQARSSTVCFELDGFIYVGLGWNGSGVFKDIWRYDPATDTWAAVAPYPGEGGRNSFSLAVGGKAYVGGGAFDTYPYYSDWWEYDPQANTWQRKASFPFGIRSGGSALVINGRAFLGLGNDLDPAHHNDWWEYNPSTDSWIEKARYPGPVSIQQSYFPLNGEGYVGAGNANLSGQNWTNQFWRYNPDSDSWSEIEEIPSPRRSTSVSFSVGNKGYTLTGDTDSRTFLRDVWEYSPEEGPDPCEDLNLQAEARLELDGPLLRAQDQSTGPVDSLVWDLGDGATLSGGTAGQEVAHLYPNAGRYTLCLTVYSFAAGAACEDVACYQLSVSDEGSSVSPIPGNGDVGLIMANVFTPNGDQINDLFLPVKYEGIAQATLQVWDRWGRLCHESNNLLGGWDGTLGGQSCRDGVYFWQCQYTDQNGNEAVIQGNVTLMR